MKSIVFISTFALSSLFVGLSHAGTYYNCQQKEEAIKYKLEIARQYKNHGKIRSLERALANVRMRCSGNNLLSNANERIDDKLEKVRDCELELAEAIAEGKSSEKISKRQLKLEEARKELLEAVRERDQISSRIGTEE